MANSSQKRKLAKLLGKLSPDGVDPEILDGVFSEVEKVKELIPQGVDVSPIYKQIQELVMKLNTDKQFSEKEKKEFEEKLKKIQEELKDNLASLRLELLHLISNRGGGSPNRKITLNGVDPLTRYTDINYLGSNITLAATNDDANKRVNITFTGSAATSPGGSNTQVQFNDSGAFGGDGGLTFNKTTDALTIGGAVSAGGLITTTKANFTGFVAVNQGGMATALNAGVAFSNFLYDNSGGFSIQSTARADVLTATSGNGLFVFTMNSVGAAAFTQYTTNGFMKFVSGNGTVSVDTNTYLTTATAATTYVPYTGATTSVNLGAQTLTTTGNIGIGVAAAASIKIYALNSTTDDGVLKLRNSRATGYSSFDTYDSSDTIRAGFGYANGSVGVTNFADRAYLYGNSKDIVISTDIGTTVHSIFKVGGTFGIGTATPTATESYSRLTVQASDGTAHIAAIINTGTGQTGFVLNRTGASSSRWNMYIPTGSIDYRFYYGDGVIANSGDKVTIQGATGWVGLNKTSPLSILHVSGGLARLPDGSVIAGNGPGIAFDSYSDTGIAANGDNLAFWESGVIALDLSTLIKEFRVPSDFKFAFSSATNNNAASDTSFYRNAAAVLRTAGSFIVDSNLLIGLTSATARLHIAAGTATASTGPIKFTMAGSVVLTTPETGAMETSTDNVYLTKKTAIRESIPGVIFTQTADKSVTNTTTETSIVGTGVGTLTLPANFFVAGKTIRVRMTGVYSTVAITGDTVTIKVKYGSTVLTSKATTALVTGGSNLSWFADCLVTCRTTGATGTVQVGGGIRYQIAGSAVIEDELNNGAATTTLDTTASGLFDITVTHSGADASNTVKSLVGAFEVLN